MALIDNPINIVFSVLLTFSPIIILFIPYLFTRRKEDKFLAIIFNRAYIGFIVFYVAYFIFPSILNFITPNPNQYLDQPYYQIGDTGQWSTEWHSEAVVKESALSLAGLFGLVGIPFPLLLEYLLQHFVNSIVIYLTYPIIILAFVFGISPVLSMIILLYQTWKEKRDEKKPLNRLIKTNRDEIKFLQKQQEEGSEAEIQTVSQEIEKLKRDISDLEQQKKDQKSINERFREIQFEMEESPFQEIRKRVKQKDWESERELLKVLIAILPITLFLLMTILQLLGETENPSLLQGTSMGWFLEIFFAYVASIVFCVYLIKASRLSKKGKFLGNQLYVAMVQSLSTVGAFMSILAVILFLVQYIDQIYVIAYFVVYFIMVSIFFVLFLDIFEPFSVYILLKLIESFKNLKLAVKRINLTNIFKSVSVGIIIGFLLAIGFLFYYVSMKGQFDNFGTVQYQTFFWLTQNYATFLLSVTLILFIRRWNWSVIGTATVTYISIFAVSLLIYGWYDDQWYKLLGLSSPIFQYAGTNLIPPFITATSVFGTSDLQWLTSIWKDGVFNDLQFIIPELHQIPVVWRGTGGQFLGLLSIPFNLFHPLAIILTYGTVLFLAKHRFHVQTQRSSMPGEEKTQFKSVFSEMGRIPSLGEIQIKSDIILIGAPSIESNRELTQKMDEAWLAIEEGQELRKLISNNLYSVTELSNESGLSYTDIYNILDDLTFDLEVPVNNVLTILHREFSYSYEEVTIDSLHIMMLDGRAVLSHTFGEESQVEPALVAGLFSAITSFAKEAVRSEQLLKTIDHGDVVLTIEYAKWVFAAIFADTTSTELRKKLSEFLDNFEERHGKTLPAWLGDLDVFLGDTKLIDEVFKSI
ncbi:MAG: hypothetical protein ACXAC8_00885 [Candidatus Hodarchaeales archaeon]|jgi:hypothetical protein